MHFQRNDQLLPCPWLHELTYLLISGVTLQCTVYWPMLRFSTGTFQVNHAYIHLENIKLMLGSNVILKTDVNSYFFTACCKPSGKLIRWWWGPCVCVLYLVLFTHYKILPTDVPAVTQTIHHTNRSEVVLAFQVSSCMDHNN